MPTAAEAANGLQSLVDNGWLVQVRAMNQPQDLANTTWIGKAIKGDQIVDASGDTFRDMGGNLIAKIAP